MFQYLLILKPLIQIPPLCPGKAIKVYRYHFKGQNGGGALVFAVFMYATLAEIWYAGEHIAGCDGSQECGYYEKLLAQDAARVQNSKSGKR